MNDLEICCIATKRSGHHAFLEWVLANRDGKYAYLNNVDPKARRLKSRVFVSNDEDLTEDNFAERPKETMVISYENRTLLEVLSSKPFKNRASEVGESARHILILFVRDPLNSLASAAKVLEVGQDRVADRARWFSMFANAWESHAAEYLGETNTVSELAPDVEFLPVSFNMFMRDQNYRDELARTLGMTGTRLNTGLSQFGKGGNTFFDDRSLYKPEADTLESRWEQLEDMEPIWRAMLRKNFAQLSSKFYSKVGLASKFEQPLENLRREAKDMLGSVVDCVGIVRFSVLSTTYNKFKAAENQTFEEYAALILSEERLAARFSLFENVCLTAFDNQTDKHFALLIVAPRLLPEKWKERLEALQAERSYLRVHYAHEADFRMSDVSKLIADEIVTTDEIFSTFRIDDDDCMSNLFIERLRAYHKPELVDYAVSFSSGYYLDISPDTKSVGLVLKDKKNIGAGLALISHRHRPTALFDLSDGHLNYHKHRPVILDGRPISWVVLNHGFNDTAGERSAERYPLSVQQAAEILSPADFSIHLQELMEALPSPRKTLEEEGTISMYWWDEKPNFGDRLGPWVTKLMCGLKPMNIIREPATRSGLVAGSTLVQSIDRPGMVLWGAGASTVLSEGYIAKLSKRAPARISAVSGPLTKTEIDRIGWECPSVFGDPGLLISRYYKPRPAPEAAGRVALIPHYSHRKFSKDIANDPRFIVINLGAEPENIVDQIAASSSVISTDLHGLIAAQSYGIPWVWLDLVDAQLRGGAFRFQDFFATLDSAAQVSIPASSLNDAGLLLEAAAKAVAPQLTISLDELAAAFPGDAVTANRSAPAFPAGRRGC